MERFYLGSHQANWLATVAVPLCVSRRRLAGRKTLPRAAAPWLLDSGGFSELSLHGAWTVAVPEYAAQARRYAAEVGSLDLAAPMDWMCEPAVLARTGRTVAQHQLLTTANYLDLLQAAPELPWFPVLQGWERDDYLRHADIYEAAGVDLDALPLVGVGTVCRRQHTGEAVSILTALAVRGYQLHGFGLKAQGLARAAGLLSSADSMAWSFTARRLRYPWCGSTKHINCANCPAYATHWRARLLAGLPATAAR